MSEQKNTTGDEQVIIECSGSASPLGGYGYSVTAWDGTTAAIERYLTNAKLFWRIAESAEIDACIASLPEDTKPIRITVPA